MEKTKNVLIVVVLLLLIFLGTMWYMGNEKNKIIVNNYKSKIERQDSLIQNYNDSIVRLDSVANKLSDNINDKDSIIKKQKGSIVYINGKYNDLRKGIVKATADSNVNYLSLRLSEIDTSYKSKTPQLVKFEGDSICLLDVEQVKMINVTFMDLDERTEELDTTRAIVKTLESEVDDFRDLVVVKDGVIELKDSIIISDNKKLEFGDEEQKRLKKEVRKQKIQKWVSVGVGVLIIGILVL